MNARTDRLLNTLRDRNDNVTPKRRDRLTLSPCLVVAFLCAFPFFHGCASNKSGKVNLVLYSTHGKELLTEFENLFEQANPQVDVRWMDMGSQDVLDRIRSEKENPQADIWWGAPSVLFQQAERENLIQPFKPSWAEQVSKESHSPTDGWYGSYETPEVIAYNSTVLRPDSVPQDWDELLDRKWRGKIILRDPLASGTMRTIFCAMIFRAYQGSGSPQAGFDWLKKLDANTKDYVANLTLLSQKLARQEGVLTVWNMPDIELQREKYHYPLAYVIPSSGTPVVTDGIAIVAGSKNFERAKLFYEFVTSQESLILAAEKFFRIPCRQDIPAERLPEWITKTSIRHMQVDWRILEQKSAEWMRFWDIEIRNKGEKD